MASSAAVEARGLTKRFGDVCAVDHVSFRLEPGTVTGFLGPNGAGKTTTLRMMLGLVEPTEGSATVRGQRYSRLSDPIKHVGAVFEATGFHPGRTARDHLRVIAAAAGLTRREVDAALARVGLGAVAARRASAFSLGMRQRLALAAGLLGNPEVLILDEPANGLDPEGVRWMRELLRDFARDGGTVLVSSHLLAEVAQTVDAVIVLDRGRLVAERSLASTGEARVRVRTPQTEKLRQGLETDGALVAVTGPDQLTVTGSTPERVGSLAQEIGAAIFESAVETPSLEDMFLGLTNTTEGGAIR